MAGAERDHAAEPSGESTHAVAAGAPSAAPASAPLSPQGLLALQRTAGNRAVGRLLQRTATGTGRGPWLAREAAITPEEKLELEPERTAPDPTAVEPAPPAAPEAVKTWTYELTFDDGPHVAELGKGVNRTEKVLDTLKAKGIKAGFFIQTGVTHRGASAVGRALVKRMHDEGHTVGIHTGGKKDHELHTTAQKDRRLKGELRSAKDYIEKVTGEEPRYVRPPTGAFNPAVSATYARLGLENLLWDIDGDAGKSLDLATLKRRFSTQLAMLNFFGVKRLPHRDGINVLYHDIQQGTADNLGAIIDHIKAATEALLPPPLPTLTPNRTRNVAAFRAP